MRKVIQPYVISKQCFRTVYTSEGPEVEAWETSPLYSSQVFGAFQDAYSVPLESLGVAPLDLYTWLLWVGASDV